MKLGQLHCRGKPIFHVGFARFIGALVDMAISPDKSKPRGY